MISRVFFWAFNLQYTFKKVGRTSRKNCSIKIYTSERRWNLAELFSQVASLSPATAGNSLFIIIRRIFNLWHTNKLTNGKSLPSDFCKYVLNVREQDRSCVNEWKGMQKRLLGLALYYLRNIQPNSPVKPYFATA